MRKILYYLVYAAWYVHSLLPMRVHYVISDVLFLLLYHVVGYRRSTVWSNIDSSFPEYGNDEKKGIQRGFYHFLCDYLVESVKLLTINEEELKRRLVFKGTERINEVVESGQSCAVYLGHYCNWEWITSLPLWVTDKAQCGQIYHPLENKDFDKLFLRLRQRFGAKCISMNDTLRKMVEYRRENQPVVIGYISDQVPFWTNIHHWCQFLHHDTAVLTGTERIARRMNHAVFYMDVRRVKRGYYEAEFKLITRDPASMPEHGITDRYFQMLEKSIRRAPEFWLWSHNRWKRTHERFDLLYQVVDGKVVRRSKPLEPWKHDDEENATAEKTEKTGEEA